MEPVIMDPRWALLTLVLTALLGLTLWLGLMILIASRTVSKNAKRFGFLGIFAVFMIWLFTLGDPHSSMNLETLYYRSINYLPDTRFTKLFKPKATTTAGSTNQSSATNPAVSTPTPVATNK